MIRNFPDAFEYVNSKYLFTKDNYPVIGELKIDEILAFSLKHVLLHILKSANKAKQETPREKKDIRKLQWIAQPDEKLGSDALAQKIATLKMLVNILSLAHIVGITKEEVAAAQMPTDLEMISMIAIKQLEEPVVPTFADTIDYLIVELATFLEKADHGNTTNWDSVDILIKRVLLATMYWFDCFWAPDFLQQIPNVMKSK